jgi:hypothetical protein
MKTFKDFTHLFVGLISFVQFLFKEMNNASILPNTFHLYIPTFSKVLKEACQRCLQLAMHMLH